MTEPLRSEAQFMLADQGERPTLWGHNGQQVKGVIRGPCMSFVLDALDSLGLIHQLQKHGALTVEHENPGDNPEMFVAMLDYLKCASIIDLEGNLTESGREFLDQYASGIATEESDPLIRAMANKDVNMLLVRNAGLVELLRNYSDTGVTPNDGSRAFLERLKELGWAEDYRNAIRLTPSGSSILKQPKVGAYMIYAAYHHGMTELPQIITDPNYVFARDMEDDIEGSADANRQFMLKFQPFLEGMDPSIENVVDIGGGNGEFSIFAHGLRPDLRYFGVEYEEVAMEANDARLKKLNPTFQCIMGDSGDPWGFIDELESMGIDPTETVVVCQNSLQEGLFGRDPAQVLKGYLPFKYMLITEIFKLSPELLARHYWEHAQPDLQLVHAISNQVLFSEDEWLEMLPAAGFEVLETHHMHPVEDQHCYANWILKPAA